MVRRLRLPLAALVVLCLAEAAAAQAPTTADQVQALGAAINLTAADVAGFTASDSDLNQLAAREPTSRCDRLTSRPVPGSYLISPLFERSGAASYQAVDSQVVVAPTAADAARDIATLQTRRARACLAGEFRRAFKTALVKSVSVTLIRPPVAAGAGLRITIVQPRGRRLVTTYADVLAFARGAVQVVLNTNSTPTPFPPSRERSLESLLLARAQQQIPVPAG